MSEYPFDEVESRWQERWRDRGAFSVDDAAERPRYVLEMFPYPSGNIHMGHVRNYTIGDAMAHFCRKQGYDVLHPMGWDAFGLPAENAARERGIPPGEWTRQNIEDMRDQLRRLGLSYDWNREITTCEPDYYRWNQRLFLEMLEEDLVYRDSTQVNWCPSCETVLANEQVHEGLCWRCDSEVHQKQQYGWFLRITDYTEQLLGDMDQLGEWPDSVTEQQRNWIGPTRGARIQFDLVGEGEPIEVFTTRPDTLYGATFMAVSPEHPRAAELPPDAEHRQSVEAFIDRVGSVDETRTTDGVFTGRHAVNPITGDEIPIYLADYVLMEFGTGAIMSVPAHDERDFEFARYHDLPIPTVVEPEDEELPDPLDEAYTADGVLVNSGDHSGLTSEEGRREITAWLEERGSGQAETTYRLRDWGISRQRYWGTPIPVVYCDECGTVPVPPEDLPVELPDDVEFTDTGNPLASSPTFRETRCPNCGGTAQRETDTMDTFVDSSWYYARFLSPGDDEQAVDPDLADRWLPVDHYIGGIEHACMHLLYARFIQKVLRDLGWVTGDEPFRHLLTQGMVLKDGTKMSKSKGNVVDPRTMIERYGADTVRMFTLFAAPPQKDLEWDESGVQGSFRFLNRVWTYCHEHGDELRGTAGEMDPDTLSEAARELRRKTHETIRDVREDLREDYQFNTAIAACMELFNAIQDADPSTNGMAARSVAVLLDLLAPVCPHFCDELAERLDQPDPPTRRPMPDWSEQALRTAEVEMAIQVNGTVRDHMTVPAGAPEETVKQQARERERIQEWLDGDDPDRIIVVPDKLVNIVV